MLLKASCTLFSAVSVCTLKLWIVNFLRNKEESLRKHLLLSSTNDKRIHGSNRAKTHGGKCCELYMQIKRKLQYQFADTQINWLMGQHNLSAFIRYCTFDILYRKKQQILSSLSFYIHYYLLPLIHVACIEICWRRVLFWIILFC